MDKHSVFFNKKVLIAGDGISGRGAKEALEHLNAECYILSDAKNIGFDPDIKYDLIVVSPSIKKEHRVFEFAERHSIPMIGEIELGYRLFDGKIIAITGTNGKTTVTSLIGEILKAAQKKVSVCGNIGISFSKCACFDNSEYCVVETSSFQLETVVDFKPRIACILNISPDHLDHHKSMEEYIKAKLNIAKNQDKDDYLILSQDDIPLSALENFHPAAKVFYTSVRGKVPGAYMLNEKIYYFDEYICDRDYIKMQGEHNVSNVLTALCAAKLLNIDNAAILETLPVFDSTAHRIKHVRLFEGKNYYNDSKGTNIAASLKAAQTMPSSTCLILGGSDKGYEFDELFFKLPPQVTYIYVIGSTGDKIIEAAKRNKFFEIEKKQSLEEAVNDSRFLNVENVLLSPACASFDMFKNYADRGEKFEKAVKEL